MRTQSWSNRRVEPSRGDPGRQTGAQAGRFVGLQRPARAERARMSTARRGTGRCSRLLTRRIPRCLESAHSQSNTPRADRERTNPGNPRESTRLRVDVESFASLSSLEQRAPTRRPRECDSSRSRGSTPSSRRAQSRSAPLLRVDATSSVASTKMRRIQTRRSTSSRRRRSGPVDCCCIGTTTATCESWLGV